MKISNSKKSRYENIGNDNIDYAIDFMRGYKERDLKLMEKCLRTHPSIVNYLSNKTTFEVYKGIVDLYSEISDLFYDSVSHFGRKEQLNNLDCIYTQFIENQKMRRSRKKSVKKKS